MVSELLREARSRLNFTNDSEYATENSDATFIVVPTPSNPDGSFSTRYIEQAAVPIGRALRRKSSFHVVTVTSTVLPGSMGRVIGPLIEETSGREMGKDFGLCYNPEFIALGDVVRGLLEPDFILIGECNKRSGDVLSGMYRPFCQKNPPIARMSLWNAELAKIALNVYVTAKITFANDLAAICEKMPTGNVDVVCNAMGLDSRIGSKYLMGGLSYGGPCFPRDNRAFSFTAQQLGCRADFSLAIDTLNRHHTDRIVTEVAQRLDSSNDSAVSVLGLTYKPNTDIIEESAAINIVIGLSKLEIRVRVFDPVGMKSAEGFLGQNILRTSTVQDCLHESDFCIIATPLDQFKRLDPSTFLNEMRHAIILDCWRILDEQKFTNQEGVEYLRLGIHGQETEGPEVEVSPMA